MNQQKLLGGVLLLAFALCAACAKPKASGGKERVVSIGGAVTEIIYALGEEDKLVGADTSSVYPEAATRLPQVGYQRQISAEGVLSLQPTIVLAMAEAGPPAALEQIESAGVKIIKVNGEHSLEGARAKIRQIAAVLNVEAKGEELIEKLDADWQAAQPCVESLSPKPKVLFIYARGAGAPQVAGRNTAAAAMIEFAGGQNAVLEFENFKPLTSEALVEMQPDAILLTSRGLESIGGAQAVLRLPGASETSAGKNKRIIAVDDLVLLGFGARTGAGVKELCEKLRH
jgi:iron complex transport system substrate-binding protein